MFAPWRPHSCAHMCMQAHTQKKSEDRLLICLPCRTQDTKDTDVFGYSAYSNVLVSLSIAAVNPGRKGFICFAASSPLERKVRGGA